MFIVTAVVLRLFKRTEPMNRDFLPLAFIKRYVGKETFIIALIDFAVNNQYVSGPLQS